MESGGSKGYEAKGCGGEKGSGGSKGYEVKG